MAFSLFIVQSGFHRLLTEFTDKAISQNVRLLVIA
jgi:hypothetical protein